MKNKIYMFFYGITIKRYSKNDLTALMVENTQKINKLPSNSVLRHTYILQNKCIKKRLVKLVCKDKVYGKGK